MNHADYLHRWDELEKLQEHYKDFRDFYADASEYLLGFTPTWMQYDIANYVVHGPLWSMVQAQRGQAKTTIAGCYAVWCLIHDPTTRVLIVSAGTAMAKQISTWCIQILNGMPELEIMRCDKSHPGARASVEAYDIHYMLKGADKSPSIACLGITSNMQGYRADLLIPDDVESSKNALTQLMREQLLHKTKDFSSINSQGKILYLGTPQSIDSVYNGLPSRDFDIRIWPGRYPSVQAEREVYGGMLAPSLVSKLKEDPNLRTGGGPSGESGQCTDPGMMDESTLTKKQVDQGKAYFNLQFMLNTALMDMDKYPLKLRDLMFYDFDLEQCPGKFWWSNDMTRRIQMEAGSPIMKELLYYAHKAHEEYFPYSTRVLSIDPAGGGQNGDETGLAILYECNGYILVQYVTGAPGGTSPEALHDILKIAEKYKCNEMIIEKNFGFGAYTEAMRAASMMYRPAGNDESEPPKGYKCDIQEVYATGQKELRIIDVMEPLMGAHKLVFSKDIIRHDIESTQKYGSGLRASYQLLFQMAKITRERGALIHDDRLDALAQGIQHLVDKIAVSVDRQLQKKKEQKLKDMQKDPYGVWRNSHTSMAAIKNKGCGSALGRFGGNPGIGIGSIPKR